MVFVILVRYSSKYSELLEEETLSWKKIILFKKLALSFVRISYHETLRKVFILTE